MSILSAGEKNKISFVLALQEQNVQSCKMYVIRIRRASPILTQILLQILRRNWLYFGLSSQSTYRLNSPFSLYCCMSWPADVVVVRLLPLPPAVTYDRRLYLLLPLLLPLLLLQCLSQFFPSFLLA